VQSLNKTDMEIAGAGMGTDGVGMAWGEGEDGDIWCGDGVRMGTRLVMRDEDGDEFRSRYCLMYTV